MLAGLPNDEQMRQGDPARGVAVLIADRNLATRGALRIALKDAETVTVVREAPDLPSAIRAVSGAQVDIVLADSRVAGLGSESARTGLAQLSLRVPVIVMEWATRASTPRHYKPPVRPATDPKTASWHSSPRR